MRDFARELLGAGVHGFIALLCYYATCYNIIRGNNKRAVAYALATVLEGYAVYLHLKDIFRKEDGDER